ncbi:hypothetical protein EJ110_NYTH24943 [Nymphaea thermarum]|nr:hypothetical protein EJ110_NYTH24943 [Nymphaea thermarum]
MFQVATAPATMLHSADATPSYPQLRIEVQHLIERCLILRMGRDDCVEALAQHANIEPLVTLTGKALHRGRRFRR